MTVQPEGSPWISVVIPTYNGGDWLLEAIASALDQGDRSPEVIVVDDASCDDTPDRVAARFPQVTLLRQVVNSGSGAHGRNLGLQAARGRYVKFLDHDDLLEPGALALELAAAEAHQADMVMARWGDVRVNPQGRLIEASRRVFIPPEPQRLIEAILLGEKVPYTAAVLYRRSFIAAQRWDARLTINDDFDWFCRQAVRSERIVRLEHTSYFWRLHSGSIQGSQRRNAKAFVEAVCIHSHVYRALGSSLEQQGRLTPAFRRLLAGQLYRDLRVLARFSPPLCRASLRCIEAWQPSFLPDASQEASPWSRALIAWLGMPAVLGLYRALMWLPDRLRFRGGRLRYCKGLEDEAWAAPRPLLVIIQNRETQFDAPLYAKIQRQGELALQVIYTTPASPAADCDQELGFAPQWDHLPAGAYPRRTLQGSRPLSLWRLSRELRRSRPALVLICGYFPRSHLMLALLLRLQGQRIGLRSDNTLSHTLFVGWRGCLRRSVIGWIQRLFHSWHPVGEQALAYLRQLSGIERPSFRFAYAVDNAWFAERSALARRQRGAFLRQQSWPEQAFVVLGVMKWSPREDPLTLIQAFALLRQRCPLARLLLVGDGPLRGEVAEACAPWAETVHCPGYSPYSQLPTWYGLADVFVHPSPDEPWGVSVNEAMACGLPVVAARGVGAAHELIEPGATGCLVPDRDPEALADVLTRLCLNPELARSWGDRGRARIATWSHAETLSAFQRALSS